MRSRELARRRRLLRMRSLHWLYLAVPPGSRLWSLHDASQAHHKPQVAAKAHCKELVHTGKAVGTDLHSQPSSLSPALIIRLSYPSSAVSSSPSSSASKKCCELLVPVVATEACPLSGRAVFRALTLLIFSGAVGDDAGGSDDVVSAAGGCWAASTVGDGVGSS